MSAARLSAKEITKRVEAARIIPSIEHGKASTFLIQIQNDSDDEITIEEVHLFSKDKIRLTNPGRPASAGAWRLPGKAKLPVAWRADPDPAAALVRMNSHQGTLFETELNLVFFTTILRRSKQFECKLWVRVDATQPKIVQLAG